jgi:hypothetical protein
MGTNFYRIPTEDEIRVRKELLIKRINDMELSIRNISDEFNYIESDYKYFHNSPWTEFLNEMKIHLGKRSAGWKFTWNFHAKKFYSNKEELLAFIRKGRVVDEYGDEMEVEEFIKMALEWGQSDGCAYNMPEKITFLEWIM